MITAKLVINCLTTPLRFACHPAECGHKAHLLIPSSREEGSAEGRERCGSPEPIQQDSIAAALLPQPAEFADQKLLVSGAQIEALARFLDQRHRPATLLGQPGDRPAQLFALRVE